MEETTIAPGTHLRLTYPVKRAKFADIYVDSDERISVYVFDSVGYNDFMREKEETDGYSEGEEDVLTFEKRLVFESERKWILVLLNSSKRSAHVRLEVKNE
jgi:hypothetical protein